MAGESPETQKSTGPPHIGAINPAIPPATVARLILYARELGRLRREGESHVSSKLLGQLLSVSDAVVRRDVNHLGSMGQRGVGYEIGPLIQQIRQTMGTNRSWKVALIGAGSLGHALMRYRGFDEQGFQLVAAFDTDPAICSRNIAGIPVLPLEQLETTIAAERVSLAILAVPVDAADAVAKRLAALGVAGILNFAPRTLQKFPGVCVVNVDLASELQQLSFAVVSQQ
ncbi:Redox-sensing transcriptional repressor Rex [Rosistilla carotiformis]|uniref:Redox-sensing transcriptional repressor Rex n=1 Tax=Rosistilla carotiformis TaxID=2528017 RepID=A0A518JW21_9BACT|nr:redox-sensing transcriptional repressor Rex [Rosistilla carotiformis]QDV69737.1 Redox-sensing transcriptional repressor Rex [Rosistilla carotiformis]